MYEDGTSSRYFTRESTSVAARTFDVADDDPHRSRRKSGFVSAKVLRLDESVKSLYETGNTELVRCVPTHLQITKTVASAFEYLRGLSDALRECLSAI